MVAEDDWVKPPSTDPQAPSVAVVIPARNAARFLDGALSSVAVQTRPPKQVVLVDDASEDKTVAVALRWKSYLPITIVELSENVGPGAARDHGVAAAEAELIAFLDADDLWLPDHLEVLVSHWASADTIVSPRALEWRSGIGVVLPGRSPQVPLRRTRQLKHLLRSNGVFTGSLVARRLLREAGAMPDAWHAEDYELWLRLVSRGARVVYPPAATVLYRRHEGSLSDSPKIFEGQIRALTEWSKDNPGIHRRTVERSIRVSQARLDLFGAYAAARAGNAGKSRSLGWRALRGGNRALRARALLLLVSPRLGVRLRDRRSPS